MFSLYNLAQLWTDENITLMKKILQSSSIFSCSRETFNISEVSDWGVQYKPDRMTSDHLIQDGWQILQSNVTFHAKFLRRMIHSGKQEDVPSVDQKSGKKSLKHGIQIELDWKTKQNKETKMKKRQPKCMQERTATKDEAKIGHSLPGE